MSIVQSVRWGDEGVVIIDQRLLPEQCVERELTTLDQVCDAIRTLAVRGAPAIGIAGAMGLVVSSPPRPGVTRDEYLTEVRRNAETIGATRPTAVNLPWALARMVRVAKETPGDPEMIRRRLFDESSAILAEDQAMCRAIGEHGASLIKPDARILTHCNTGALATGGIGTALASIYVAAERGLRPQVFADETRPLLQGSRLTAWELHEAGIPVTILPDSAAASLMREKEIDLVIVGADRIAANGDVANKIGTYHLAIAARHHGIPFYVAAPSSTIDPETASGDAILIEQRDPAELRRLGSTPTAPASVAAYNPAFDVTPALLISGIITERGVHRPPYRF